MQRQFRPKPSPLPLLGGVDNSAYASAPRHTNVYDQAANSEQDPPWKRMIFYGGSVKHDNTFENASKRTNADYVEGERAAKEDIHLITTAKSVVEKINEQKANSVQSIDFFNHSGRNALYFKEGVNDLYRSKKDRRKYQLLNHESALIDDIDFQVFTNAAKIEFHGCNTGSFISGQKMDPFAQIFSKKLGEAGKTNAIVIGHMTDANPDDHSMGKVDDYRHGRRRVFHNGEVLFFTGVEGRILGSEIKKFLDKKKRLGNQYDGTKEFLKRSN